MPHRGDAAEQEELALVARLTKLDRSEAAADFFLQINVLLIAYRVATSNTAEPSTSSLPSFSFSLCTQLQANHQCDKIFKKKYTFSLRSTAHEKVVHPELKLLNSIIPLHNDLTWDPERVAVVDRWSLFTDVNYKSSEWGLKMVAIIGR